MSEMSPSEKLFQKIVTLLINETKDIPDGEELFEVMNTVLINMVTNFITIREKERSTGEIINDYKLFCSELMIAIHHRTNKETMQ